jgi:hypothetical protein
MKNFGALRAALHRRIVASHRLDALGSACSLLWAVSLRPKQHSVVLDLLPSSPRDNYSLTAIIKKPRYHNGFRGFLFTQISILVQIWCKSIKKHILGGVQCGFVLYAFLHLWWSNTVL